MRYELAAILVSYVPREPASGILGDNAKTSISKVSRKKKGTAGCSNNDAIMQMAF